MLQTKHIFIFFIGIVTIGLYPSNLPAHSWVAPKHEAIRTNPGNMDQKSLKAGEAKFAEFCNSCHGVDGQGLPAATTGLRHDTPDLPKRLITHSDGDFHWKIKNGKGEMPGFAKELSDEEIWNIVHYIRSLAN